MPPSCLILFCCALAAAAAPGQAVAQAAKAPARAAEPIGRLFFTPAQRASLDIARTQRARTTLSTEANAEETVAASAPQTITYGGMVRRSDGRSTIWINNRPVNDRNPIGGGTLVGRVRPDGGISIQVPQSGRSVDLKVGQSIELLSGAIEESYSRKPLEPEPKPAAKPAAGAKGAKPTPPEAAKAAERALQGAAAARPGAANEPAPQGPAR